MHRLWEHGFPHERLQAKTYMNAAAGSQACSARSQLLGSAFRVNAEPI